MLHLLRRLQAELGLTYFFVGHDLGVMRYMCDEIAGMRSGSIIEVGGRDEIFSRPSHVYTRSLLDSVPIADPKIERRRQRERAGSTQEHQDITFNVGY